MTKAELVSQVRNKAGLASKASAEKAVNNLLELIVDALVNGDKLTLTGFGTFSVRTRAERTGRNPRTGNPVTITARKVVKFTPGKNLKDAVK